MGSRVERCDVEQACRLLGHGGHVAAQVREAQKTIVNNIQTPMVEPSYRMSPASGSGIRTLQWLRKVSQS